jgi:hypothetical protein
MHTTHDTKDCHKHEKDGSEKADFRAATKGGKKPNPAKQSFAQMREKLDKLMKAIKKSTANAVEMIVIPTPNRESGRVA